MIKDIINGILDIDMLIGSVLIKFLLQVVDLTGTTTTRRVL